MRKGRRRSTILQTCNMIPCSLYRLTSHNSTSSTNRAEPTEVAPHPGRTRRALSPDRDKHGLPTGPVDRNEPSHRIFCAPRRLFSKRLDSFVSNHPSRGDQESASETVAPVQQYPDVRISIEIQHGSSQDNLETGLGQASWRGIDPVKAGSAGSSTATHPITTSLASLLARCRGPWARVSAVTGWETAPHPGASSDDPPAPTPTGAGGGGGPRTHRRRPSAPCQPGPARRRPPRARP